MTTEEFDHPGHAEVAHDGREAEANQTHGPRHPRKGAGLVGIGQGAVAQYDGAYEDASRAFVRALAGDLACTRLDSTIDESLGRVFLKVSTGYDGKETESALKKMNDLAHFAADVLGDKFRVLDPIPFGASVFAFGVV